MLATVWPELHLVTKCEHGRRPAETIDALEAINAGVLGYRLKPIAVDCEPIEAAVYSGRPQDAHTERTRPDFIAGPWRG
jgi:hypothetical protein